MDKDILIQMMARALKEYRTFMDRLEEMQWPVDREIDLALEAFEKYEEEQKEREN